MLIFYLRGSSFTKKLLKCQETHWGWFCLSSCGLCFSCFIDFWCGGCSQWKWFPSSLPLAPVQSYKLRVLVSVFNISSLRHLYRVKNVIFSVTPRTFNSHYVLCSVMGSVGCRRRDLEGLRTPSVTDIPECRPGARHRAKNWGYKDEPTEIPYPRGLSSLPRDRGSFLYHGTAQWGQLMGGRSCQCIPLRSLLKATDTLLVAKSKDPFLVLTLLYLPPVLSLLIIPTLAIILFNRYLLSG